MSRLSVWDRYPDLESREFRELVAVTAQTLVDTGLAAEPVSSEILESSNRAIARDLTPTLQKSNPHVTDWQVQAVLDDEDLATEACRRVLDEVRRRPDLAERVAAAYEERLQKMTGIEVVLLAGALVVLAIRIKRVRWGHHEVDFEPAGETVASFVAELVKRIAGGA